MLKISVNESAGSRVFVLEGRLVAPWTDELRSACQPAQTGVDDRELIVDVGGLTAISADGEETLLCLLMQGAKFRGTGVYMRTVLEQLARRAAER